MTTYTNLFGCEKDLVCLKIYNLMNKKDFKLSKKYTILFKKYAKIYNIDINISIAIAKQESGLNHNIHRYKKGLIFIKKCDNLKCYETTEKVKIYTDIGLFQIHYKTIEYYNLDPIKLKNNLEYMFESHFKILKDKIKICKGEKSWSCYHSFNKKQKNIYYNLVSRFL